MDEHRFDDLARSLATTSRRRAARLLVAGLVGTLALPIEDATAACVRLGRSCGRGKRCCAGTACRRGRCRCTTGVPCAGRCCPAGQRCGDGRCVADCVPEAQATICDGDACGPQRNNCGQEVDCGPCVCVPESTLVTCSPNRCGVRRNNCGDEINCERCEGTYRDCDPSGTCVCGAPRQECLGFCVDTSTDFSNCGGCGRSCDANQRCTDGKCISVYCPAVVGCLASGSPACDIRKTGTCLCLQTVDGGTHCGHPDLRQIVPCTSNADCRSEFGPGAGCVHHPDRCGMGAVCVRVCDISS